MKMQFYKQSGSFLIRDKKKSKDEMYLYIPCVPQWESHVSQVPLRYPNMGYPGGPKNFTLFEPTGRT